MIVGTVSDHSLADRNPNFGSLAMTTGEMAKPATIAAIVGNTAIGVERTMSREPCCSRTRLPFMNMAAIVLRGN